MRRKFKLKVSYTFNGCFTLRAASGKEAARLVSEQCGTVLSAIQTTLGEESEVDWHFDKHPRLAIREVIALPETLTGRSCRAWESSIPGSGSSGVIPTMKCPVVVSSVRVMTIRRHPPTRILS